MTPESIFTVATFAFVFVALTVASFRALEILDNRKQAQAAENARRDRIARQAYKGPRYTAHGRKIDQ